MKVSENNVILYSFADSLLRALFHEDGSFSATSLESGVNYYVESGCW